MCKYVFDNILKKVTKIYISGSKKLFEKYQLFYLRLTNAQNNYFGVIFSHKLVSNSLYIQNLTVLGVKRTNK